MRILAVDYGEARTGLAISDYTGLIATPLMVLRDRNMDILIGKIAQVTKDNEVGEIVVGLPLNMDGSKGEKSLKCEMVAEKLKERSKVPVLLFDERLSTVTAHEIVNANRNTSKSGKSHRKRHRRSDKIVDAIAAAVILEGYLNERGEV